MLPLILFSISLDQSHDLQRSLVYHCLLVLTSAGVGAIISSLSWAVPSNYIHPPPPRFPRTSRWIRTLSWVIEAGKAYFVPSVYIPKPDVIHLRKRKPLYNDRTPSNIKALRYHDEPKV